MMALLVKKLCGSKIFYSCSQNHIFRCSFCFSTSITQSKTTLKPQSIVEEFLLSTLGLSPEKATWAADQLNHHLKSLEKPESVLNCLKSYGFEDTQIKKLVSWNPRWLCFDVETTLKPKFEGLQDLGFSGPELIQLILSNPVILHSSFERSVRPKIEFWREILGSFELMSKSLRAKQCLLNFSLNQRVLPNLAFLREFGIPDERISFIVQRHPRIISQKPEGMKELAGGLKEWGYLVAQRCLCGLLTLFGSSPKTNLMANWEL